MSSRTYTYEDAIYLVLTLKQADHGLLALDSQPAETAQSLFRLMTKDQRQEVIGRIEECCIRVGHLCSEG